MAPRSIHVELATLKATLRERGLKATASRIACLRYLAEHSSPVTHRELSDALARSGLDRATLFRNLNDLVVVGLARRTIIGGAWHFERRSDDEANHAHFVCEACGEVTCVRGVRVTVRAATAPRALKTERFEIHLSGTCDRCT